MQPSSEHKDKKQKFVGVRNKNDKHQNITSSHDNNHIVEIGDSKEQNIPL